MARYAEGTTVSISKSRAEIEALVEKFGGDDILSGSIDGQHFVQFRAKGRWVRLTVNHATPGKTPASADAENRRRWRALVLLVKAKFTSVTDGITEFEQEFLGHVVLDQNRTVYEVMREPINDHYLSGSPIALPAPKV